MREKEREGVVDRPTDRQPDRSMLHVVRGACVRACALSLQARRQRRRRRRRRRPSRKPAGNGGKEGSGERRAASARPTDRPSTEREVNELGAAAVGLSRLAHRVARSGKDAAGGAPRSRRRAGRRSITECPPYCRTCGPELEFKIQRECGDFLGKSALGPSTQWRAVCARAVASSGPLFDRVIRNKLGA